jgi:hypothetical protein
VNFVIVRKAVLRFERECNIAIFIFLQGTGAVVDQQACLALVVVACGSETVRC